jgi:hypothetical protein
MADTKYNGWTNYATWRVWTEHYANDEGGQAALREMVAHCHGDAVELADTMQQDMSEWLEDNAGEASAYLLGYASAFVNQVNWYEMAETALEDEGPNL